MDIYIMNKMSEETLKHSNNYNKYKWTEVSDQDRDFQKSFLRDH